MEISYKRYVLAWIGGILREIFYKRYVLAWTGG